MINLKIKINAINGLVNTIIEQYLHSFYLNSAMA